MQRSAVFLESCLVVLLLVALAQVGAVDLKAFCEKQCKVGMGGNLCKCSAFHFAGKREGPAGRMDLIGGKATRRERRRYLGARRGAPAQIALLKNFIEAAKANRILRDKLEVFRRDYLKNDDGMP